MCGICGYISKRKIEDRTLEEMRDTMVHRGPNDALIIARDRMGVKPFYYYYNPSEKDFVFASELKPIMKYPYSRTPISLNPEPTPSTRTITFGFINTGILSNQRAKHRSTLSPTSLQPRKI